MHMDIQAFFASLRLMAEGMLCIFAVMAVIIAVVLLLGRLTNGKGQDAA